MIPLVDHETMRLVNRILEEQGYLMIACTRPFEPGELMSHFTVGEKGAKRRVPGPVAVIGMATAAEWFAQRAKYRPDATNPVEPGLFFVKVVAE